VAIMAFTIGTITSVKDTFRYSTPGKINTEDPRYKALEKDGTLAAIMEEEMSLSPEQRMAYEVMGGRELLIRNHMNRYDSEGNFRKHFYLYWSSVIGRFSIWLHGRICFSKDEI